MLITNVLQTNRLIRVYRIKPAIHLFGILTDHCLAINLSEVLDKLFSEGHAALIVVAVTADGGLEEGMVFLLEVA